MHALSGSPGMYVESRRCRELQVISERVVLDVMHVMWMPSLRGVHGVDGIRSTTQDRTWQSPTLQRSITGGGTTMHSRFTHWFLSDVQACNVDLINLILPL